MTVFNTRIRRIARRALAALAAVACTMSLAACGADESGKIRIGIKFDQPGLGFKKSGTYVGFDVDVAKYVAKKLGYSEDEIVWKEAPSKQREAMLQNGDVDMILATYSITDERKKSWDFTTPYYTDYVSVLVEDSNGIKDLAGLKDKVVGVSSGSTSARALVKAMIDAGVLDGANFDADTFNADTWKEGISFRQYDDYPAISTALSANEIQGFCVDKSILAIYKTDGRSYVDAEFSPQEYGIATKKGSDFSTLCVELVQGWLADGTVESLIKENGLS